jgi:hypothetical protein
MALSPAVETLLVSLCGALDAQVATQPADETGAPSSSSLLDPVFPRFRLPSSLAVGLLASTSATHPPRLLFYSVHHAHGHRAHDLLQYPSCGGEVPSFLVA